MTNYFGDQGGEEAAILFEQFHKKNPLENRRFFPSHIIEE